MPHLSCAERNFKTEVYFVNLVFTTSQIHQTGDKLLPNLKTLCIVFKIVLWTEKYGYRSKKYAS